MFKYLEVKIKIIFLKFKVDFGNVIENYNVLVISVNQLIFFNLDIFDETTTVATSPTEGEVLLLTREDKMHPF